MIIHVYFWTNIFEMISETSALGSCVGTQSIAVNICGSAIRLVIL